jgi:hypothetical protein
MGILHFGQFEMTIFPDISGAVFNVSFERTDACTCMLGIRVFKIREWRRFATDAKEVASKVLHSMQAFPFRIVSAAGTEDKELP